MKKVSLKKGLGLLGFSNIKVNMNYNYRSGFMEKDGKRQETIKYLSTLGINADERFTDWEQHNNPELEDETGTGGLWDLSREIMDELSEDEMQTLIYGLLCLLS